MTHNLVKVRAILVAMTAVVMLTAVPALAQDPDARVSLGAAAGLATPFHGDFDFTASAWQADIRLNASRYIGFTVFLEEWRHRDEDVLTDQTISGPSGPLGRAGRVTTRTDHRTRALGWSLLGRGNAGRVTFTGGGGISYLVYSRDFTQTSTGCEPASLCSQFSRQLDNSSFAAQLQAGVDVAVAPHVALMGQFRLLVPVEDPGGGHNTFVGGVRVLF